jgi:hypothetical protein
MKFGGKFLIEPFDGLLPIPGGSELAVLSVPLRVPSNLNCLWKFDRSIKMQSTATRVSREQTAFRLTVHKADVPYQVLAPAPSCKNDVIVAFAIKNLPVLAKRANCLAEHAPSWRAGPSSRKYVGVKKENAAAPTARQYHQL